MAVRAGPGGRSTPPNSATPVSKALALAERIGNPTLIAYAAFMTGSASGLAGDTNRAAADLQLARSAALEVRNAWIGAMSGVSTNWSALELEPAEILARAVDAVDELQRTGWTSHAWNAAWFLPTWLLALGRSEEAAFVHGACSTSGIGDLLASLPEPLTSLPDGGDPVLAARYRQGEHRTLADVIRVVRGESPLPRLR
jgi:hypothetical protein